MNRARCPECGGRFTIRLDGTLRKHVRRVPSMGWWMTEGCPGSNRPPEGGAA